MCHSQSLDFQSPYSFLSLLVTIDIVRIYERGLTFQILTNVYEDTFPQRFIEILYSQSQNHFQNTTVMVGISVVVQKELELLLPLLDRLI